MTSKYQIRNSNIEALRFILMVLIFLWHLLIHGCEFIFIGHIDYKYNIYLSIVTAVITAPCVNCFMFISGWFGMKFRMSKLLKLLLVCIICGLLCMPINKLTGFSYDNRGGGLRWLYITLFPVSNNVWWFMTAYVMVYLVSPFIEKGMELVDKRRILYILFAMAMIEILCIPMRVNWGSQFFGMLFIYMIGRYMKLNNISLNKKQSANLYATSTLILICALILINVLPIKKGAMFGSLQFSNPLIILQAIGMFFIAKNIKPHYNKYVNYIFSPCLCIYLITELLRPYKFVVNLLDESIFKGSLAIFIIISGCLLTGHLIFFAADKIVRQCQIGFHAIKR